MTASSGLALDQMVANLFRSARKAGVPQGVLRARLRQWLELQPPDHFLLIEPEEELRRIVASEIEQAVNTPVVSCGLEDCAKLVEGSIPVALPNRLTTVRQALPDGTEVLELHFRSVTSSLAEWLPAPSGALVGVASSWPDFLKLARTMLSAAGFHPDGLVFRDARKPNWQRGLKQTAAVVCDSITARDLPQGCRAIPFALLAESSMDELKRYLGFVSQPLGSS
jgi:GntR family transcriptional regulator